MSQIKFIIYFLLIFFQNHCLKAQSFTTISPKNNILLSDSNITFNWNFVTGYSNYRLEISQDTFFNNYIYQSGLVNQNDFSYQFSDFGNYYWRVKSYTATNDSILSNLNRLELFSPLLIPDLQAWFVPDVGVNTINNKITQWLDISGLNRIAFQADTLKSPTLLPNSLNGHATILFDGINDALIFQDSISLNTVVTLSAWNENVNVFPSYFTLISCSNPNAGDQVFITNSGTSNFYSGGFFGNDFYCNGQLSNDFSILSQYKVISAFKPFSKAYFGAKGLRIGNDGYYLPWKGYIPEIILFNNLTINETDLAKINLYLFNKYAPPVDLGADIYIQYGFCDTMLTAYKPWFTNYIWKKEGSTDTLSTDSVLTVTQAGTYILSATDIFNRVTTDDIYIEYPNPNITFSDTTICFGDTIEVASNLSFDAGYSFVWYDYAVSNTTEVFTECAISLVVTDTNNCFSPSDTVIVSIDSLPLHVSLGEDLSICSGNSISLDFYPENSNALTFLWSGGSTDSVLIVETSGFYSVSISNLRGCSGSDTIAVNIIGDAPITDFYADTVCLESPTTFSNLSSLTYDSLLWDFGDLSSDTIFSPSHVFASSGTYQVSLTMYSGSCFNSISKSVLVKPNPIADFTATSSCVGYPVVFSNTSNENGSGSISDYFWQFDLYGTSISSDTSFHFPTIGDQTVSLTITSSNGCTDSVSKTITTVSTTSLPLISLVMPSNNSLLTNNSIPFSWSSSLSVSNVLEISTDSFATTLFSDTTQINNMNVTLSLTNNQIVYWRVKSYNFCNQEVTSEIRYFQYFNPSELPGINTWLAADNYVEVDGSNSVSAWENAVDITDSLFQMADGLRPLMINQNVLINNKPSLKFDGINDLLLNNNNHTFGAAFIVSRWSGTEITFPGYNGLMAANSDLSPPFPYIFIGNQGTTNMYVSQPWQGNVLVNNAILNNYAPLDRFKILYGKSSTPQNLPGFIVGSAANSWGYWNGEIAEIMVFDQAPNDTIKNIIYRYFQNKYTPPVNLGADIHIPYGFCDTTISAYKPWYTHYQWNTNNPADTLEYISTNKSGTYTVTVTDIFGFLSTDSINVSFPTLGLLNQDTIICFGDTIAIFNALSLDNGYSFLWHDNSSETTFNVFTNDTVFVVVTDTNNCFSPSDTVIVSIDSLPLHVSLGEDLSICSGNSISLDFYPENSNALTFLWSGGSTDSVLIVETSGFYSVSISNLRGCSGSDTIAVNIIGDAPITDFYADTVCLESPTTFSNLSSLTYDSLLWDFGDLSSDTIFSPSHVFASSGTYQVSLTMYSGSCFNSISKSVLVKPNPIADFTATSSCVGYPVVFSNTSNENGSGSISDYFWQFDLYGTSISSDTSFHFPTIGDQTVSLTITSSNGCTDSVSKTITTVSTTSLPLISLVMPSNNSLLTNNSIPFSWSSSLSVSNVLEISTDSFATTLFSDTTQINNMNVTLSLTNNQIVYWRVKSYNFCNQEVTSEIRYFQYFNPSELPGINTWLAADNYVEVDGSNSVSAWENAVDITDSLFQMADGLRPLMINQNVLINNKPSLKFDGINDLLLNNNNHTFGAAFIVSRWSGTEITFPGYNGLMAANSDLSPPFPYIFIGNQGTTNMYVSQPWQGNVLVNNAILNNYAPLDRFKILYGKSSTPQNLPGFIVGSAANSWGYWNGEIAEIMVFDQAPNDTIKNIIYRYFQNKYTPPVNLGADIHIPYGFCDTTISAYKPWYTHYQWNTSNPADTLEYITTNKSGTYAVTVTDIFGFQSTDSINITFPELNPQNLADTTICLYDTLVWNPGLGAAYNFAWSNSTNQPLLNITQTGDYYYQVTDTNILQCSRTSDTIHVVVNEFVNIASLGADTNLCAGNKLHLQQGAQEAITYLWSDGTTNNELPVFTTGTYSLTVANSHGCLATDTIQIQNITGNAPVVNFTLQSQCFGNTTLFADSSFSTDNSNIVSWSWNFGDNTQASSENPSHVFALADTFAVTLIVETDSGCSNYLTKNIIIRPLPVPDFMPEQGCAGNPVSFTNLSAVTGGQIVSSLWNFGDTTVSAENNPVHFFNDTYIYNVTLKTTSNFGCTDSVVKLFTVKPSPIAEFDNSPACENRAVYFSSQVQTQDWNPLTSYKWEFGDNSQGTAINPVHTYNDTGTYTVRFIVKAMNSCADTVLRQISVTENPLAVLNSYDACVNSLVQITNSSIGQNLTSWKWNIDSIGELTGQNPSVSFADTGIYNVRLIIETQAACSDTAVNTVSVHENPIAAFSVNQAIAVPGEVLAFSNNSTGGTQYVWSFGDGSGSQLQNPVHAYTDSGRYQISLIAISPFACTDTANLFIRVIVPVYDIAVLDIQPVIENGFIKLTVQLANFGSMPLDSVMLKIDAGNGKQIIEALNYIFAPGEIINYQLMAQIQTGNNLPSFICADALLEGNQTDLVLSNNHYCIPVSEVFEVLKPYPSPTEYYIFIEFIIPEDDEVKISLYNELGQKMQQLYNTNATAGFNRKLFYTQHLSQGAYTLQVEYKGAIKTTRFSKL